MSRALIGLPLLAILMLIAGCTVEDGKEAGQDVKKTGEDDKKVGEDGKKTGEEGKKEDGSKAEVDILDKVLEMNSKKYAAPPTTFRKGHVTPRKLAASAIKRSEDGFTVQLPSKAPIPTPAVHGGNVYVSGGFHSKEYYCFNAQSGEFVWGISLDDDGPSTAACYDDVVVFNTESCTIFAVDAKTGKQLWSYWLGDPLMSSPTISGGRVFASYPCNGAVVGQQAGNAQAQNQAVNQVQVGALLVEKNATEEAASDKKDNGKKRPPCSHALACFDLKTGKILWQKWIDSDVMSAPVAVDDELYVTTFGGTVYRFDQASGKIHSAKRSRATSAPIVVGKDVYMTLRADQVGSDEVKESAVRIDRSSEEQHFAVNTQDALYLDKKVQKQSKMVAKGMKLDAGNGFAGGAPAQANASVAYENVGQMNVSTLQAFQGSRVMNGWGHNYNCMGDVLYCNDPVTGKQLWSTKLEGDMKTAGGFLAAPPVAAGDQMFLGTLKGEVMQLDPKSGKTTKTYKIGSPIRFQPVVEGGRIYVGTQDGKLICVDTGNKDYTGWAQWGGNAARTGVREMLAKKGNIEKSK